MGDVHNLEAVVAGHICLDITPNFISEGSKDIHQILRPGTLTNVAGVKIGTGGAVSNTGIALSILGIQTQLMGKIGRDYFGEGILQLVGERGLQEGMTIAEDASTSYTIVIVPPETDRIFLHDPGANDSFSAADINYDITDKAKIFHFGYPSLMKTMYQNGCQELIEMFKRIKAQGLTTSLDMTLPDPASEAGQVDWDKVLKEVLPYVDLFVPSLEELLYMAERKEYLALMKESQGGDILKYYDLSSLNELGQKMIEYGAKIVLIKCGAKGCYLKTSSMDRLSEMGKAMPKDLEHWSQRELFEEVFKVPKVLSATGAGDTCIAGFLAGLLRGLNAQESLRLACGVGAECVQDYDALGGIRSMEETCRKIKAGWEKVRISLAGPYWHYDQDQQHWLGEADRSSYGELKKIKNK